MMIWFGVGWVLLVVILSMSMRQAYRARMQEWRDECRAMDEYFMRERNRITAAYFRSIGEEDTARKYDP